MAKIPVNLNVDDEVKGPCDALVDAAQDLKRKVTLGATIHDVWKDLAPALQDIASLGQDLKENQDNLDYIAIALERFGRALVG